MQLLIRSAGTNVQIPHVNTYAYDYYTCSRPKFEDDGSSESSKFPRKKALFPSVASPSLPRHLQESNIRRKKRKKKKEKTKQEEEGLAGVSRVSRLQGLWVLQMHPPLTLHKHPACAQVILNFKKCHEDHPVQKFFGACNDLKIQLDQCFREEKAVKRKANFEASKEFKEKLRASKASKGAAEQI